MSTPTLIEIRQLSKVFHMGSQTIRAVDNLDLDIPAGSFTVIMGPSGSGKSTLLYLLGGLDQPTSGSLKVDGRLLEKMDENQLALYRRDKVGFIFQSFNLIASMEALENVAFPMRFAGIPAHTRHARSTTLMQQVGLGKRLHHRPTELSGGQQQRVAVARALVNDPALILADEPTGNLDSSSGLGILKLLARLQQEGRTIVVVTHDPRTLHFASQAVYLLDGHAVREADYQAAINLSELEQDEEYPE
ncbi:MAG: ABC transporter ATP-binding protein [Anaerolineaceae bacterium]|jgi:putative ABC transport system ATP-binding protein|nr:ABC transporter ATP-binding protein [Anaerolineaceae bacterium]